MLPGGQEGRLVCRTGREKYWFVDHVTMVMFASRGGLCFPSGIPCSQHE